MKAVCICPKCKKTFETDCEACVESGKHSHRCGCKESSVKVKWNVYQENESELIEEDFK